MNYHLYSCPMLTQLSIRNYATVDALEIDFSAGMSVITGETGAGKSIILGALGLTLGDRADRGVIREGADKADITAEFDITDKAGAIQWLTEHDLSGQDSQQETADAEHAGSYCLFRRVVNSDGRSRAYINGSAVTLNNLKTLGEMLIDIHSQHEHQSLLHRATHLRLLDDFGGLQGQAQKLAALWKRWHDNRTTLDSLREQSAESSAQTQLLSYQLGELNELAVAEDEVEQLNIEYKKLNQADDSIANLNSAMALCTGNEEGSEDGNLGQRLSQALALLQALPHKEPRLEEVSSLLESAQIQIEEAVSELRLEIEQFEVNPERLEQVNQRLADIHSIARKHKVKVEEIAALTADLQAQLDLLVNSDEELERLQELDTALREEYQGLALKLSKARLKASKKLAPAVNEQLQTLGMADASLSIALLDNENPDPTPRGLEAVEFLVSTNRGQTPKPLSKIASGGELSRISLAIQVITAQTSSTATLVFDEVDVGIGGAVARAVGELLRQLGTAAQILCVTHQAQVAGQGNHHYVVSKQTRGDSTQTSIDLLDEAERTRELARMLGGELSGSDRSSDEGYSEESLAHAQKMVANS